MVSQKQDVENQSRWRSRYYEALGELDKREKGWRDAEQLLRHLITSLTLAADRHHQALAANLTELRNAVRDGRDILRLRDLVEQINRQIGELDDLRSQSADQGHPATKLLDILDKLHLQEVEGSELRQFKKHINQLKPGDDAGPLYEQFAALMNASLAVEDDSALVKTRKQKLLDRILLRQEKARKLVEAEVQADSGQKERPVPQRLIAPAVGDLLVQLALRMPETVRRRINYPALKKHTNRARQRKDLIAIVDVIAQNVEAAYTQEQTPLIVIDDDSAGALAQAVGQMIQQLNPPEDLKQRISELEKFYNERDKDIDGLLHCLNSLAEMVAEICSRLACQRDELEAFFVQLNMQLEDLDFGLQKTGSLYHESHQDVLHMDKAVHDEIRGIQDAMLAAEDLAVVKTSLQLRLDAIDQHLLRYHDAEKQRFEQAQKMIEELTDKVTEVESGSSRLQRYLEGPQKQAMCDVLTGIPNRRAYEERLAAEVARCKRYGTALTMVVWDVDKFKSINDNYGRAGGDRVLRVVAGMLCEYVRETDFVARYGSEEFVMLMPETSAEHACQVADKLRQKIEDTPFHFHDTRVNVSVSAGVAQYRQDELITSLFERADAALYAAMECGRNQVKSAEK